MKPHLTLRRVEEMPQNDAPTRRHLSGAFLLLFVQQAVGLPAVKTVLNFKDCFSAHNISCEHGADIVKRQYRQ